MLVFLSQFCIIKKKAGKVLPLIYFKWNSILMNFTLIEGENLSWGDKAVKEKQDFHRWMKLYMEETINNEEPCRQMLRLV